VEESTKKVSPMIQAGYCWVLLRRVPVVTIAPRQSSVPVRSDIGPKFIFSSGIDHSMPPKEMLVLSLYEHAVEQLSGNVQDIKATYGMYIFLEVDQSRLWTQAHSPRKQLHPLEGRVL
jgi:hypothetical protein